MKCVGGVESELSCKPQHFEAHGWISCDLLHMTSNSASQLDTRLKLTTMFQSLIGRPGALDQ